MFDFILKIACRSFGMPLFVPREFLGEGPVSPVHMPSLQAFEKCISLLLMLSNRPNSEKIINRPILSSWAHQAQRRMVYLGFVRAAPAFNPKENLEGHWMLLDVKSLVEFQFF